MTHPNIAVADPFDVLAAHRPADDRIGARWPAAERTALLDHVLATPQPQVRETARRGPRRRVIYRVAAAAVIAIAGITGGGLLPRGALPEASALDRLAAVAAAQPALTIPQGHYLQQTTSSHQQAGSVPDKTGGMQLPIETRTRETWTGADGRSWARETSGGVTTTFAFAAPSDDQIAGTPSRVSALPTDPGALETYLRAHVSGSTSPDEAVFTYVGDITRTGYVPSPVRVAAIQVLRALPGVTTTVHDGRLDVVFRSPATRPGVSATLTFDQSTSVLLGEALDAPDLHYTEQLGESSVVDAVPADVLATAMADAVGVATPGR